MTAAVGPPKWDAGIVVQCSGGIAGINRVVSLSPDGWLSRSERGDRSPARVGRVPPAEAQALVARLDKVSFATLTDLPRNSQIRDGIDCAITRSGDGSHTVAFPAGSRATTRYNDLRYAEVRAVMSAIFKSADRVRLNPQPIPPKEKPSNGRPMSSPTKKEIF